MSTAASPASASSLIEPLVARSCVPELQIEGENRVSDAKTRVHAAKTNTFSHGIDINHVIRDLTKYVDEDDDDEDDLDAIAPAPRQAPPAGWGKLLSA